MGKPYKDLRGNWTCEDEVALPDNRVLKISTHKTWGGHLVTSAIVGKHEHGGFSYTMYQDYSERMISTDYPRVTSKVVDTQHAEAMEQIDRVIASAIAYYAAKEAATA